MKIQYLLRKKSQYLAIILFLAVAPVSICSTADGAESQSATFSWQANSTDSAILGYRLYYGPQSRLNNDGTLKANFSYPQYVDFTDFTRCSGTNYSSCEQVGSEEVQCVGLYSDTPTCTLLNLDGSLFFALTAYSSTAESGFTQEIKWQGTAANEVGSLQQIINMLLLSD